MKSYFNSKKNLRKHRPDKVLKRIKNSYENNSHKLLLSLTKESSPLLNYNYNSQLSFLEIKKDDNKKLIEELTISLQYTVSLWRSQKRKGLRYLKTCDYILDILLKINFLELNFF